MAMAARRSDIAMEFQKKTLQQPLTGIQEHLMDTATAACNNAASLGSIMQDRIQGHVSPDLVCYSP